MQSLNQFLKFPNLCDDLRIYALTFLDHQTLINYSQCAEQCDIDIQRFRTRAPDEVSMCEKDSDLSDGWSIIVTLEYKQRGNNGRDRTESSCFEYCDWSCYNETLEKIEEHFLKVFKYVKNRNTKELTIDIAKWPSGLFNHGFFPEIKNLTVYTWRTMFNNFIKFAKTTELRLNELTLRHPTDRLDMPRKTEKMREVMQSEFFKQAESVWVETKCELNEEDFLGLQNPKIYFELDSHKISSEAIRKKVNELNNTGTLQHILISCPFWSQPKLEKIYPLEYQQEYARQQRRARRQGRRFNERSANQVTIGAVNVMIRCNDWDLIITNNGDD